MAEQPIANLKGTNSSFGDKVPQHVALVDTSGNIIESFGGTGGTAVADDADFVAGTTQGTPAMGAYQSSPTAVTDGDLGIIGIDADRNVKVNVVAGGTAGAQYTEGDTDASITGTALMMEGAADTLVAATGTAANGLDVDVTRVSGTVTVDGSGVTQPISHAALTELAAAIDTEVQVDVVGALPAGTNNIGDVDVLSVVPGTGATNLGKAEDAAHTTGDVGVMALAVRSDAGGAIAGADGDYTPLQVDSNGALRVTGGWGGTEYTEGDADTTFTGGVALAEGPSNVATPLLVDGSQHLQVDIAASSATVAVSAASLPLPTGAATLAEQQSQTTALQLLDDVVFAEDVAAQAADKGIAVLAVRRDADTSLVGTDNDYAQLQVDAAGRLKVEAFSGETLPVSLASVPSHAVTNAGIFAVQVDGAALTALQLIDDPVVTDGAAFTPGTTKVMMAGFEADEASTGSVDEGDAGAARMTLDRKVIVQPQPHTAGGLSIFRSLDLDETEEEVKASAGQVYAVWFSNLATTTRFLKFYNATAANVTVGTTTPVLTLALPGNSSDDISGVFSSTMGIAFDTAITVAATTAVADNDSGAPAANDVIVNIFYK